LRSVMTMLEMRTRSLQSRFCAGSTTWAR
jgi:hypothetical protein